MSRRVEGGETRRAVLQFLFLSCFRDQHICHCATLCVCALRIWSVSRLSLVFYTEVQWEKKDLSSLNQMKYGMESSGSFARY